MSERTIVVVLTEPTVLSVSLGSVDRTRDCGVDLERHMLPYSLCREGAEAWLEDLDGYRIVDFDRLGASAEELEQIADGAISMVVDNGGVAAANGLTTFQASRVFMVSLSAELHGLEAAATTRGIIDAAAGKRAVVNDEVWFEVLPRLEREGCLMPEEIRMAVETSPRLGALSEIMESPDSVAVEELKAMLESLPAGVDAEDKRAFVERAFYVFFQDALELTTTLGAEALHRQSLRLAAAHTRVMFDHGYDNSDPAYARLVRAELTRTQQ